MAVLSKNKNLMVLALLLAITLASWLTLYMLAIDNKTAGTLLLCLAFVKVQLIICEFMELNKAASGVRIAFWLWTIGVCAVCIGMYL